MKPILTLIFILLGLINISIPAQFEKDIIPTNKGDLDQISGQNYSCRSLQQIS